MDGVKSVVARIPVVSLPSLAGVTPLEKKLIVGISMYGTWKLYDAGCFHYVGRQMRSGVPGLKWMRALMGKYEVVHNRAAPRSCNVLESRRPGSEENSMTTPRCQAVVAYKAEGRMVVVGNVIRFDRNFIVGPDHVLGGPVSDVKYVKGSQAWVSLEGKERIFLDTDLVAIQMTEKELSTIGVAVCKIATLPDVGILAQVVGPESKGTVGVLKHDSRLFGRVVYEGTTLAGYSGAAYLTGNGVLGIHQAGGAVNSGYSASYVWNLLLLELGLKLESSEDWLLGQFKHSKKLEWRNCAAPDEVLVRVNGQYARVEKDSMYRAFGPDWQANEKFENRPSDIRFTYGPEIPESAVANFVSNAQANGAGEANGSKRPGVSSLLEDTQEPERPSHLSLWNEYKQLSPQQRKKFRSLMTSVLNQTSTTSGQENGGL